MTWFDPERATHNEPSVYAASLALRPSVVWASGSPVWSSSFHRSPGVSDVTHNALFAATMPFAPALTGIRSTIRSVEGSIRATAPSSYNATHREPAAVTEASAQDPMEARSVTVPVAGSILR